MSSLDKLSQDGNSLSLLSYFLDLDFSFVCDEIVTSKDPDMNQRKKTKETAHSVLITRGSL